jgi:hypothetical protein
MDRPIARLKLLTAEGKVADAILYCHLETTTIAGTTYRLLKLDTPADTSGTTLSASTASVARVVWGKFVFSLTGIAKIFASTIYATYRAYTGGGTVNAEIDILIRKADGTVRATIATGVSKSANLGTSWATYTGASYSFAEYTVVDQTDYFEIDYIANVTAKKSGQYAYLRIDDNTLALADQTRSQEWKLTGVTTLGATDISSNSATLNGRINGTETMTIRGFEWGVQSGNYTDSWTETGSFPAGGYSHGITGLEPGRTYYYRAKAYSDSTGWIYGNEVSFTCLGEFVVGYSTSDSATAYNSQRKTFYYGGYFWAFYWDGSNWVYNTSTDGRFWGTPTAFASGIYTRGYFDVKVTPTGEVFYARGYYDGTNYYVLFRKGTISGSGISWGSEVQMNFGPYYYSGLSVDKGSDGRYWIIIHQYGNNVQAYFSSDGSYWTATIVGTATVSTDTGGTLVVPMASGKMMAFVKDYNNVLYYNIWDGSDWGTLTSLGVTLVGGWGWFSAVSNGDTVHLVYLKGDGTIAYRKYDGTSWGSETTLVSSASLTSAPVISLDQASGDLYVFAATKTTGSPPGWTANHIYYIKYTASTGSWGSWTDWIDESAEVLTYAYNLTCFYQAYGGYVGLLYMTKTASPYNVKFRSLTLVAVVETIVAKDFPMNYLPSPIRAQQLTSKVSGATIQMVSNDYPLALIKKGKAEELRSKFS